MNSIDLKKMFAEGLKLFNSKRYEQAFKIFKERGKHRNSFCPYRKRQTRLSNSKRNNVYYCNQQTTVTFSF